MPVGSSTHQLGHHARGGGARTQGGRKEETAVRLTDLLAVMFCCLAAARRSRPVTHPTVHT